MPLNTRKRALRWIPLLVSLVLLFQALSAHAAGPKHVLIIHSFGNAAPPFTTHSTAFETELTRRIGEPVDLDELSLDVARYVSLDMEDALVDLMRVRQTNWKPDLVVPVGSPAGVFVARHRDRLFAAGTPIVYVGMDKRRLPPGALQQNAAFVGESFDLRAWVDDILQMAPDTKNIAVVIGDSPLERAWADVLKTEYQCFADRVSFTWLNDLSLDGILQRTRNLPPHSFILHVLMMRDGNGVSHDGDEVLKQIHAVANAPINGIYQHQLGLGITGGRLYQAEAEGEEAARLAIRILRGEPASGFQPMIVGPLPPRYDWRELQKWRIAEKLLPKGSTILFRTPTLWQKYWVWIIGCAAVILAQALLIAALIVNRMRRRRAERALRESEARVTLAAEAARMGWWELDIATGGMWASEMLRELFDLKDETAINLSILENRVHPEDRAARAAAIDSAIRGLGEYDVKYRVVLQDQTTRWLSGRGRRMIDAEGKLTRLLGVSMDITERNEALLSRRRAEEEAQRQREQIDLLGRASLLGEMTASLAHELSQPLTAILANASAGVRFIDGGGTEPGELREIFSEIGSGGRRASDIIQSVRNAIKRGDTMSCRICINNVVTNIALILQADAAAYSCNIQTNLTENLPPIEADPIQISQVLINLVANAFHAMGNMPTARRRVEITTRLDVSGSIGVTVRDHGTGIAAEMEERIFDHFYTTRQDGLGMGLSIVRSIIVAHGGKITVSNAAGGGACFDFTLPVAAEFRA